MFLYTVNLYISIRVNVYQIMRYHCVFKIISSENGAREEAELITSLHSYTYEIVDW